MSLDQPGKAPTSARLVAVAVALAAVLVLVLVALLDHLGA